MLTLVFCCQTIQGVLRLGKTYPVIEWIEHKYGCDPVVMCDDDVPRLMWKGFFHD